MSQNEEGAKDPKRGMNFINDVKLRLSVELGRSELDLDTVLKLSKGSVIELSKMSGEPLDIRANGKLVAQGEAVIVNEKFGIRVTQIVTPEDEEVLT